MSVKDVLKDNKKYLLLILLLVVVCIIAVFSLKGGFITPLPLGSTNKGDYTEPSDVMESGVDYSVSVKTIYGNIVIDLYEDKAPKNVNSFLFLVGKKYYDNLSFHKVIKDFVIQAGDDEGDGSGDPGYTVEKEKLSGEFQSYSVGMANASQFFIVLPMADTYQFDGKYTLIGEVKSGFDVVDSIAKVEVDDSYKPNNTVKINSIQILED